MNRTSTRGRRSARAAGKRETEGREAHPASLFLSPRLSLTCLLLIAATLIVYAPVRNFAFVNCDDPEYVTDNVHVVRGLTWEGALWVLKYADEANPLTWLSHMAMVQFFGMEAGAHHIANLLLHMLNTLLLFGVLYRMTGARGRSAFVAGLFALHPLHVESVAWVTERKDVLSTLFWMLTLWAYVTYVRRPARRRYALVVLWLALGLLAKPMLVTLPFALLLLDIWPLRRIELEDDAGRFGLAAFRRRRYELLRLAREQIPLFALAFVSAVLTILAQHRVGALAGLQGIPLSFRLVNALASYLAYIGKMLWPVQLAAYYPIGASAPIMEAFLGAALLIGVTVLALRAGQQHGYFLTGWLWYVGVLIPVIGLMQAGGQAMADRYTYVPLIGLFIIVAWGAPELVARWRAIRLALPAAAVCVLVACAALANAQVKYWSDSATLWQRALEVTRDNHFAHNNLGDVLLKQGRTGEAITHFSEAIRIRPNYAHAHNNLGMALSNEGRLDEAARSFREALRIDPNYAYAQDNLGMVFIRQRKLDEAARYITAALSNKPDFPEAHSNLAAVLMAQGQLEEAKRHLALALRIKPDNVEARNNLGMVLMRQGRLDEAVSQLSEALRIKPDYAEAHANLGMALMYQGKQEEAERRFAEAIRIRPALAQAIASLKLRTESRNTQ